MEPQKNQIAQPAGGPRSTPEQELVLGHLEEQGEGGAAQERGDHLRKQAAHTTTPRKRLAAPSTAPTPMAIQEATSSVSIRRIMPER